MKKGYSKIIINELVLPNAGVNLTSAQVDLAVSFSCFTMKALFT